MASEQKAELQREILQLYERRTKAGDRQTMGIEYAKLTVVSPDSNFVYEMRCTDGSRNGQLVAIVVGKRTYHTSHDEPVLLFDIHRCGAC
jgi:hypothetical protein